MRLDVKANGIEFPKAERRKVHEVAGLLTQAAKFDPSFEPAAKSLTEALDLVGAVEEEKPKPAKEQKKSA